MSKTVSGASNKTTVRANSGLTLMVLPIFKFSHGGGDFTAARHVLEKFITCLQDKIESRRRNFAFFTQNGYRITATSAAKTFFILMRALFVRLATAKERS